MRLISLTVAGYRQFHDKVALEFPTGLTGICGPNGAGKSKLIESIGYALFGPQRSLLPSSDKEEDVASAGGGGAKVHPEVTLVVESHRERYRIVRARKEKGRDCRIERIVAASAPDGGGTNTEAVIVLATSPSEVTKKVVELFGITPESYLRTFVARQKEVAGIQAVGGEKRRKLINRLIGIAHIEKALALAEQESKRRQDNLDERVASEGGAADVEAAKSRLNSRLDEARTALTREGDAARLRDAARQATAAAAIAAKQSELEELSAGAPDLERNLQEAMARQEAALSASRKVAEADAVLRDTASAPAEVERQEALQTVADLRQQVDTAASTLENLESRQAEREALLKLLRAAGEQVETAQTRWGRLQAETDTAERARAEAEGAAERAEERLQTVMEMGPTGACERCGQQLGPNLETALAHLEAERDRALRIAEEARAAAEEARRAVQAFAGIQAQAVEERDRLQGECDAGAELPGQLAEARQSYDSLMETLNEYPPGLREADYEPEAHKDARDAVARRLTAENTRQENVGVAAQADVATEGAARMERQWEQSTARRQILAEELAVLAEAQAAADESQRHLDREELAEAEAERAWETAASERAQADAQVTVARSAVMLAEERAAALQRLRRDLEIAERTESLLGATRNEITGEACPRLSEMMDGWARALMGPHFRMVRLTEDYRIEADNGSGVHTIEHFSGGEQTLLAVMLRVAISLYSQERAGIGPGFLVLDEVFGDQDQLHRGQLVQFLSEITSHYSQIVIVNHVADVTEMLNTIIEVEPVGDRISRARLRRQ